MDRLARRRRAALRCVGLVVGLVCAGPGLGVRPARAASLRWMDGMEVHESVQSVSLEIVLSRPVRVLGYAPRGRARLVEIRIDPGAGPRADDERITDEESLRVAPAAAAWLRAVRLEPQSGGGGLLVVEFVESVAFTVSSADAGRTVVLRMEKGARGSPAPAPARPAAPIEDPGALLEEAGAAMHAGHYPRAIALYTKVLQAPEGPWSPVALEYLGLARQKNGQRAHARAEYELYLMRYPDGEGAGRVRQRLEALRTARQPSRTALAPVAPRAQTELDGYGTISTAYQRVETFADLSGAVLGDSSQIFEGDLTGLARRGDWDARLRASGYYRYDYTDDDTGDGSRVRYLSLELRNRQLRTRGVLGRQPGRGGGILGRFDGARVDVGITDAFEVGGVFGFPQVSSIDGGLDTSRMFGGLRMGGRRLFDALDTELYVIGQVADGLVDRIGLGGELRYAGPIGSAFLTVDFDPYYASLNLAALSGTIGLTRTTWLNCYADHRNAPFLTTRNALIGQPGASLSTLELSFSDSQIETLAEDRTSQVTTLTLGLEQQVGERWRLLADATATTMTGTPASGGVSATPGTGWEFAWLAQAIGRDLLVDGDSTRLALRVFQGRLYTGFTLLASARYPLPAGWRLTPLLSAEYRDHDATRDVVTLRPGVQVQYRFRRLTFETDVRGEWMRGVGGGGTARPVESQAGYVLYASIRLDL